MQRERRWCLRKPASLTVKLHSGAETVTDCAAQDISLEGLFLKTEYRPELSSTVDLTILPSGHPDVEPIQLSARVVHKTVNGIGVVFHDLSIDAIKTLRRLFYG